MLKSFTIIFSHLIEDLIRNLSGPLGRRIRYWYYKRFLGSCGKNVNIDEGVFFEGKKNIHLKNNVWIDKHVQLIASKQPKNNTRRVGKLDLPAGTITIGSNSHIGLNTIIQGHGGVKIGDHFTTSAGCKIYTLSNDPKLCKKGTYSNDSEDVHYCVSSIQIDNNVWLGLNVCVLGGHIESNVFVHPSQVIFKDVPQNTVVKQTEPLIVEKRFL